MNENRTFVTPVFCVFAVGDQRFDANDVVDAAWFRGDLRARWQEFLLGLACERTADEEGTQSDGEALQALSEDVRYRHDLITGAETEAWLTSRNLSLDDLTDHVHRRYWREHAIGASGEGNTKAGPLTAAGSEACRPGRRPLPGLAEAGDRDVSHETEIDYLNAEPELRELFLHDLLFGQEFDELVRLLSWRVAGSVATVRTDEVISDRLEAERSRFFQRMGLAPWQVSDGLQRLGRDVSWFETLIEQEAGYRSTCERLRTAENRARTLAALRLQLTRFEVELMDLESVDAVREACLCLTADGLSMETLAGQEHCRIEKRELLLEALPEELQPEFLSSERGKVLQLITSDERFQVCRIAAKREPALTDQDVLARIDGELITAHFNNLVSKHIVFLLERGPPA